MCWGMTFAGTNTQLARRLLLLSRQAEEASSHLQVTSQMVQFCCLHAGCVPVAATVAALSGCWLLCWLGCPLSDEQAGTQAQPTGNSADGEVPAAEGRQRFVTSGSSTPTHINVAYLHLPCTLYVKQRAS